MSGNEIIGMVRAVFEWASLVIEVLGAGIIVAGVIKVAITRGTIRYLFKLGQPGRTRATSISWARPCCWVWSFSLRRTWSGRSHWNPP